MSKVRLLDKHTAELIAAGEVVERPSSVVKELVENCIDAGASVITVEIRHGGSSYIRVTDNGEGIAPDDVPTAFLRHATSKIRVGTDLDSIATLGFRGEALASICAVSKMELITRTADSDVGVHYVIEGSDEVVNEEIGCAVGTTIIVREMFFNTPARRKFLKSDKTEGNAIAAVIDRVALSHPEISFRFVREGKEVLLTPGDGKLRSAIHAVYGREFTLGLIPVKYSYNNVSVEGFVSKPVNSRPNRAMQIFFINGRYVRSNTMQRALEEACKGAVMIGKYPACVLGISLDCSAVDVNVHPAKLEVRFTEERPIYAEFDAPRDVELPPVRRVNLSPNMHEYSGVQIDLNQSVRSEAIRSRTEQGLQNQGHHRPVQPSAAADAPLRVSDPGVSVPLRNAGFVPPPTYEDAVRAAEPEIHGTLPPEAPSQAREEGADEMLSDALANNGIPENSFAEKMEPVEVDQQTKADNTETIENTEPADSFILPAYRIVGEIFNTYILIESGGELILIDKHAAHERLIYERLLRQRDNPDSQLLLTPLPITLDKNQYDAVTGSIELLADAGFEVEDFGMGTVLLRSVPTILSGDDAEGAFLEIAGHLRAGHTSVTTEKIDWIYHTIACKSAVKGGDKNLPGELAELVLTLINNPDVRYCPHGRPIFVSLKQREIEKYFGRIQA